MPERTLMVDTARIAWSLIRYNARIIFATKFLYFQLTALVFFIIVVATNLSSSTDLTAGAMYGLLLLPGILLIFYPSTFGIQNDVDAQTIEVIFGIPDYRYKVWLLRLILSFGLVAAMLLGLSAATALILLNIPVFKMTFHLLFPVLFVGSAAFLVSTLVRNAYGTAVILVLVGLVFWIFGEPLAASQWNLFLNPFQLPSEINEAVWEKTIVTNRLLLAFGGLGAVFWGLLNLQKREKFL